MKNLNYKKIKGYIEGYYGKLLTWNERIDIINALKKNDMNFYFYCPKEDVNHRFKWRQNYTSEWFNNFRKFTKFALEKKIEVISGISPGLDFDFKSYAQGNKSEIKILIKKFRTFLAYGSSNLAILFDDIPNDFKLKVKNGEEGIIHASIVNEIVHELKKPIFTVPRIYSDELISDNKKYICDFFNTINDEVQIFYTGKNIVSKNFNTNQNIIKKKIKDNKIINWDNFYANDYCPKKLFIGPWKNKNLVNKSMINGTGMIETDKLIIEIVNKTTYNKNLSHWKEILLRNNIPDQFFTISKPFLEPNFTFEDQPKTFQYSNKTYEALDFLLWRWKTKMSREWYTYVLNFKHDLQIFDKRLSFNRILKTQTYPFQNVLKYRRDLK